MADDSQLGEAAILVTTNTLNTPGPVILSFLYCEIKHLNKLFTFQLLPEHSSDSKNGGSFSH